MAESKSLKRLATFFLLAVILTSSATTQALSQHRHHGGGYDGYGGNNRGYYSEPPPRRDIYCARCRQNYNDGSYYVGELVNGMRQGYGDYFYTNGSSYSGNWWSGSKHGDGQMTFPNGQVENHRYNMERLLSRNVVVAAPQPRQAPQQSAPSYQAQQQREPPRATPAPTKNLTFEDLYNQSYPAFLARNPKQTCESANSSLWTNKDFCNKGAPGTPYDSLTQMQHFYRSSCLPETIFHLERFLKERGC